MALLSTPDAAGASLGPQDEEEPALTERYQTTVPQPLRRAHGFRKCHRIRQAFRANGEVGRGRRRHRRDPLAVGGGHGIAFVRLS